MTMMIEVVMNVAMSRRCYLNKSLFLILKIILQTIIMINEKMKGLVVMNNKVTKNVVRDPPAKF
jgi:hypothetical protein